MIRKFIIWFAVAFQYFFWPFFKLQTTFRFFHSLWIRHQSQRILHRAWYSALLMGWNSFFHRINDVISTLVFSNTVLTHETNYFPQIRNLLPKILIIE
jgi:hypothetical protein